tara:strand:+ start:145 stop:312 length:168 start_codon:yes stop_codon:yes gene_type:complete
MLKRYIHLGVNGLTVQVKLDDEGIVIDAYKGQECIATTCKSYVDMDIEIKEIENE